MDYRLLGPLEVWDGDRLIEIRGAKERVLLALLLLDANQLVPVDRLIDELWGDEPPQTARKSLQVRISHLRKALRVSRSAAGDAVVSLSNGYLIRVEPDQLDLHRFERLLAEAEEAHARKATGSAAELLRDALNLWRGPALGDLLDTSFAQRAAGRLEELRLMAFEERIDADLELGRDAELIGELEGLVARHPFRERLRGQLMLALYRSGRQAEALAAYQAARHALVDELGIEPSPLLQQLERDILRQDPTLDLASVPAADRSILVASRDEDALAPLVELATVLARHARHELIVVRALAVDGDIARATSRLNKKREALLAEGLAARVAAFTSANPGDELVRIAAEQDVDLLLVDGHPALVTDTALVALLERSSCDVGVLVRRAEPRDRGPVLVPFTGAEHDWAAVEVGAWMAGAWGSPLQLAGAAADPSSGSRDASRLLAHASLAVQRGLGVATEALLIPPTSEQLVRAAENSALVVLGVPERWRQQGLGSARLEFVEAARAPTLLVRRGPRPGGLAPHESLTRFTWSLGSRQLPPD